MFFYANVAAGVVGLRISVTCDFDSSQSDILKLTPLLFSPLWRVWLTFDQPMKSYLSENAHRLSRLVPASGCVVAAGASRSGAFSIRLAPVAAISLNRH